MLFYLLSALALVLGSVFSWLVFTFVAVNYSHKARTIREAAMKLPGLERKPLIGDIGQIPRKQEKLVHFFVQWGLKYKGLFCVLFGPQPIVVITKGSIAGQILKSSKHSEKSPFYEFVHPWLGTGLLTSKGEKWRQRRKLITPAFHFDILDRSFVSMMKHTTVAMNLLESMAERGEFVDIWEIMSMLALDIVSDAAMGVDLGSQMHNPDSLEYVQNRAAVTELLAERFRVPFLWNDFCYFYLSQRGRKHTYLLKRLHKFTTDVITRRWTELQAMNENEENNEASGSSSKKRNSFLDLLLTAKQEHGLTFADIREEVDTFMFEGHDTTSSSMSCALQALCNNPEVLAKLQEEVDSAFEGIEIDEDNAKQVKNTLLNMPYLEAVLKESLRMYPSVPNYGRSLTEDDEINGYKLLKGTYIMLQAYGIHHDPDIYREPYRFDPDRWIRKEVPVEENPFCYIPFSAGPRNCIGQKFALLEEKLVIASIVKNFDMVSDTEAKDFAVFGQIIIQPVKKFNIKFTKRQ